jgi:hypothetical protein
MRRTAVKLLAAAVGATAVLSAAPAMAATTAATTQAPSISPAFACPNHDFCFWQNPGRKGAGFAFFPGNYSVHTYHRLTTWYPYALLGSVRNRWAHRIFVSRNNPPSSGPNLCYPPGGIGSPNEDLYWVYIGASNTC